MHKVLLIFFLLDVFIIYGVISMVTEVSDKRSKCGGYCEEYDSILPNCTIVVTDKNSYCAIEAKKICLARDPNYCKFKWKDCNINFSCNSIEVEGKEIYMCVAMILFIIQYGAKYLFVIITTVAVVSDRSYNPIIFDDNVFIDFSYYVTHVAIVHITICILMMTRYISLYYYGYWIFLLISTYYLFYTKLVDKLNGKKF